jgi:hypothetical protein
MGALIVALLPDAKSGTRRPGAIDKSNQIRAPREFFSSVTAEKALMRAKKGNGLPKRGNELPLAGAKSQNVSYEKTIAAAVRRELGGSHQAVKTLMKRTGLAPGRQRTGWLVRRGPPAAIW